MAHCLHTCPKMMMNFTLRDEFFFVIIENQSKTWDLAHMEFVLSSSDSQFF